MSAVRAAAQIDDLYRRAVEQASDVDDAALAEWLAEAAETLGAPPDKTDARILRQAVRAARKLARHWGDRDPSALPDWRNGVDEALGARAWDTQLDLVMGALERDPDPELFEEAKTRFRAARFQPWMEGVGYGEWLAERSP